MKCDAMNLEVSGSREVATLSMNESDLRACLALNTEIAIPHTGKVVLRSLNETL